MLFTVTYNTHLGQKKELNREHFRANFFSNFPRGLTLDETPSRAHTGRWYHEYNRSHRSLRDEFCEDRQISEFVPETIDVVRKLIL